MSEAEQAVSEADQVMSEAGQAVSEAGQAMSEADQAVSDAELDLEESAERGVVAKPRKDKSGIVYLSRVPPFMKPNKMRNIMSCYGEVGRIFLQPEDDLTRKRRKMTGGSGKKSFTEGWIEFKKKRVAKAVVQNLNSNILGGKKGSYYHDDIWSMKYLPRFKWNNLTEKLAYDSQVRKKRLHAEISQANKEANFYIEQVDRNKQISAIKRKRENKVLKSDAPSQKSEAPKSEVKSVKQRKLVNSSEKSKRVLRNVFTQ